MIHKTAANGTAFPAKIPPPPSAEPFLPSIPPPLLLPRQRRPTRTYPLRREKPASDPDGKMFPRPGGPAWVFVSGFLRWNSGATRRHTKNAPGKIVPGASVSHLSFSHASLSVSSGTRALCSAPSRTVPLPPSSRSGKHSFRSGLSHVIQGNQAADRLQKVLEPVGQIPEK
jgi:hypothetical protein